MSVMVVVPSLTECQQRYPPAIARIVIGFESLCSPKMGSRIDEPGGVEHQRQPEKNAPKQHAPTTKNKEHHSYHQKRNPVEVGKPAVVAVVNQIRCIASDGGITVILCCAPQYPTNVCPPAAVAWRMWITRPICMRMMYAVRHYPFNWTTFKGH